MHSPETGLQVAPPQLQTFLQCFPQNPFWQATAEKEKKKKRQLFLSMTDSVVIISSKLLNLYVFLEIMNILESSDKKINFNAC